MDACTQICSDRVRFLKEQLLSRERELCSERALLITAAYQEHANDPVIIKRAKAFRKILRNITVYILDQELIVGHQASRQCSAPVFPEYDVAWLEEELDILETRPQDSFKVPDRVKQDLQSIFPYWRDRGIRKALLNALPADVRKQRLQARVFSITAHEETALGHVLLDYAQVINLGFEGIKGEIHDRMAALETTVPRDMEKHLFYRAALIACDAAVEFAHRYADLAEEMAQAETRPGRKQELEQIAAVCRRVPAKPARNFRESLQALWFVQLIPQIENNGSSYSPGRIDQYLYPHLSKRPGGWGSHERSGPGASGLLVAQVLRTAAAIQHRSRQDHGWLPNGPKRDRRRRRQTGARCHQRALLPLSQRTGTRGAGPAQPHCENPSRLAARVPFQSG